MKRFVDPDASLLEAAKWLEDNKREGVICPCCDQVAKIYRRKLNSGMCRSMIDMWRLRRIDWVNVTREISSRSREEGKLGWWGLGEAHETRGYHRLTIRGSAFVKNRLRVPKHALVYNDKLLELDDTETTNIIEALGDHFDYEELMRG